MKKTINILQTCLLIFITCHVVKGQNFEIEITESAIGYDQFGKSAKTNINYFRGWSVHSDVTIWRTINRGKKFQHRIGVGYSWLRNMSSDSRINSFYLPIRLGIDYQTKYDRLQITGIVSNYINTNEKSDNFALNYAQKSAFMNLDLGIRFKKGKRAYWSFTSPVTIYPIYARRYSTFGPDSKGYNQRVEMIGLNVGLKYTLGKI